MDKLLEGLFEEYRIVQNKIDNIATFELKVRGWCITLESAIIISIMSGKIEFVTPLLGVALLIIVVLVFQFLEQEQLETKKVLSKRAIDIEQAIDRLLIVKGENYNKRKAINDNVFSKLKGIPRTAIYLKNFGRNRTFKSFKNMFTWKNHIFYYSQYIVIVILSIITLYGYLNSDDNKLIKSNISYDETSGGCTMSDDVINDVENNLYTLLGQIEYGDISDIETYWAALAESIENHPKYKKYSESSSSSSSLSESLKLFNNLIDDKLYDLIYEMESLCEGGGSTDSIDEDEIEKLQGYAIEFEEKFLEFIAKLRGFNE